MKPTSELYELIKSLSGSEKRFIKLNASKLKGNKNYIKLFDAIDMQKSFDESELRNKFKNEKFIGNLTVTKNYLYNLIFRNLISYYSDKSIDNKLSNILFRCKILFDKALYRQYFKTIENGKELARKYERYSYLLEFIEFEKQIMKKDEIGKKDMNQIYDEELDTLDKIKTINECKRSVSNLFRILRTVGLIRDKTSEKQINYIMQRYELKIDNKSIRAIENIYLAEYLGNRLKGNYKEAILFCKKRFQLINEHSGIFMNFLLEPGLDSLEFHISSAISDKNFNEAKKIFGKYKKLYNLKYLDGINYRLTDFDIRLSEAIDNGDKRVSEKLIPDLENYLSSNKGKILVNAENYFYYNISKYYFVTSNFIEALRTINEHLGNKLSKLTPEFESYLRILLVLIHFEIGNFKLLKYLIPSTRKFLLSRKKLFKFEYSVLRFILRMVNSKSKKEILPLYLNFKEELLELRKDRYEKNAFEYIDLTKWIEAKIKIIDH